jgi:hypothetical protein
MGESTADCRSYLLGIFPERTGCMIGLARLPFGFAVSELRVGQLYVKSPDDRVDLNDIAVPE